MRFLWIDSLCIVQDDRQDWTDQALAICKIYGNAFLTIAATRCHGCQDSLLPYFDRRIRGSDETGNQLEVALHFDCPHLFSSGSKNALYPLLGRAWIFQGRLLSRRVLHFGLDEVFWECMETTSFQCPLGEASIQ